MVVVEPFEIYNVVTGTFRLDGGAMFGVVPKVLWEKAADVDAENRILLATRTLLAVNRRARRVVLVDTGCGTKWSQAAASRFAIRHDREAVSRALADAHLTPADVTDVFVTHLHFDHNGGLTEWDDEPGGPTRLLYPKARHWLHRRQWDHAHDPTPRDRASYLPEDYEALAAAAVINFVEGDEPPPPFEGVRWMLSHGHTPYQLHPLFGGAAGTLLWTGDVIPTVSHLRPAWVMAYDLYPLTTMSEKQEFSRRAIDEGTWLALPHDPAVGAAAIGGSVDRPIVERTVL
ncbi:MAG: MBL fold metallo-hydrolase [Planctomycetes bacterium]|nr:MBL fold metallo-hydrolase [Planctomycetota bacterium]